MRFGAIAPTLVAVACGGHASQPNHVKAVVVSPEPVRPADSGSSHDEVDAFVATAGPGDAPTQYVRDERSSRLAVPVPRGHGREEWTAPLGLSPSFVLVAGNRYAVAGLDAWVLFDGRGRRVGAGKSATSVRLDRASGAVVTDDARSADTPADAKVALHDGLAVMVRSGGVYIGERAIEGKLDALEVAIDESNLACVVVQQNNELSMWTIPIGANGGIGRYRIPGRGGRVVAPPVLGKSVRVLVMDTGIIAFGLDGKRLWERPGVPTGGVTISSDDQVLIADKAKVVAVDSRGRATDLWAGKNVIYKTPPILTAMGVLLVASQQLLHAITFG